MTNANRRTFLSVAGLLLASPALSCDGSTGPGGSTGSGGATGSGGSTGSSSATGSGGAPPIQTPDWLQDVPLNELVSIPGTTGAGGAPVDTFSGFTLKTDTSELFCLCCGGHESNDNRVTSINLMDDAPAWVLRHAPSAKADLVADQPYNADGLPVSRHTYRHNIWVPGLNRLMMFGCRGTWPNAHHYPTVDGFDPDTNTWDAAGTWPSILDKLGFGQVRDGLGRVWTEGFRRFDPATKTWSNPGIAGLASAAFRTPAAYDSERDQIFCMQWGDGMGFDPQQVSASRLFASKTTREVVTFGAASSAAYDQFQVDKPSYSAMDYDTVNGKFLFYAGLGKPSPGRMYWITPNSGTTWDLEIATFGGAMLPATSSALIDGKLAYVPALRGFVLMPSAASGLFFLRTA